MAKPDTHPRTFQVALSGAETLLGRELTEVLEQNLKDTLVTPYSATGESSIGESEGEAVFVDALDEKSIASADAIIAAGSSVGSLKAYQLTKKSRTRIPLIDCTGSLEQEPEVTILSPIAGEPNPPGAWLFVTAQPAAAAIALTLQRLTRYRPLNRAVVNIFEPASERGKPGAAELHQQISSLLAFRASDKNVFDAQLGFNMLAEYGPAAPVPLAAVERRVERHLATLLKNSNPPFVMPSVRVIQAPIFHAYSLSFWIEFSADVTVQEIVHALASAQIEVREPGQEAPNSVAAAGHDGLIAGDIRLDSNNRRAVWIWTVCDNLRSTAQAALAILQAVKTKKP